MIFLELRREPGVYSRVTTVMILQVRLCSAMSGLLSSYEGHLRNLLEAWQANTDDFQHEAEDPGPLSSHHSDIGIPINFQLGVHSRVTEAMAIQNSCLFSDVWTPV